MSGLSVSLSSLRLRAFDNWDFNLGAARRAKVQAYQYAKHAVKLIGLKRAADWLEGGIHRELNAPVLSLPIMVVDDQASILRAVESSLRMLGFNRIMCFANSNRAVTAAASFAPALVITDLDMPGGLQGHQLIERIAGIPDLAKPAFVLHSGNRATRAPMGSIAETIIRHNVITVMKGDHNLADLVFHFALARVRKLPFTLPEVPRIEEPAQFDALRKTPGCKITSALIHNINNIIAIIGPNIDFYERDPSDPTVLNDIGEAVYNFLALVQALEGTLRLDLNTVRDVTETSLYARLKGHELDTLRNNFPLLPRHSRNNMKIPLEQILAEGLTEMKTVLQTLLEEAIGAVPQITAETRDRFRAAQRKLMNTIHAANLVNNGENADLVTNFAITYGLLNSTSSGSSYPSSSS